MHRKHQRNYARTMAFSGRRTPKWIRQDGLRLCECESNIHGSQPEQCHPARMILRNYVSHVVFIQCDAHNHRTCRKHTHTHKHFAVDTKSMNECAVTPCGQDVDAYFIRANGYACVCVLVVLSLAGCRLPDGRNKRRVVCVNASTHMRLSLCVGHR